MSDINLLQGSEVFEAEKKSNLRFFKWLGFFLLGLSIVVYGFLFFLNKSLDKQVIEAGAKQQAVQAAVMQQSGYKNFLSSQNKVKDMKTLLDQHLIWSDMIQKFAEATLKTASYSKFTANADGSVTITGVVPDFQNLDKLYKAYLLTDFSDYIKEVKLVSVSLGGSDQENKSGVNFTVRITFNTNLLKPTIQAQPQTLTEQAQ